MVELILFICIVSWFYAKTGGYHNYLLAREENQKRIEQEEKKLFDSLPPDFFDKFHEYVEKERTDGLSVGSKKD